MYVDVLESVLGVFPIEGFGTLRHRSPDSIIRHVLRPRLLPCFENVSLSRNVKGISPLANSVLRVDTPCAHDSGRT